MGYFDDLIRQTKSVSVIGAGNKAEVSFDQLNKERFKKLIPQIENIDEYSLSVEIKNSLDIISKDIISNDRSYVGILTNPKFISAYARALSSVPINPEIRIAANKVTYDYFTSDNPDFIIKSKYLELSKIVNRPSINRLIGIGLDENTASNLAICRYSSSNEQVNCKRLNFAIYNKDPEVMTEQIIIWIYEAMFDKITDLFLATMFEIYSEQQQEDFGDDFCEIYGTVGLAVLVILNNMTSDNIQKVLTSYSNEWVRKEKTRTRFSLRSLSNDFSRITRVVDYLRSQGIELP